MGLAGEIRSVSRTESRITEAARLGFKRILLPERSPQLKNTNLKLVPVDTLTTALKVLGLKR